MNFRFLVFVLLKLIGFSEKLIGVLSENIILNNSGECYLDEGRLCVNSTSVILNRGMNPGGFLTLRCQIPEVGKGQNLNPLVQIQASTRANYTSLLYNINQDSVEINDLNWHLTSDKAILPDNTTFSKNDTIHFAVGIDTNSFSTIVINSKNVIRLKFKGNEQLTKFKSVKSDYCSWKYEMSLVFPSTKQNVKYVPKDTNSTELVSSSNSTGNSTKSLSSS
ncbi:uncharacterized protein cubi_00350 [Cryptosporidium ubiquitum]|uniref:Uncharacterized protein n=1 Tax=Cryptosporidium ubiquitum TaxID=857276 RepID=A0A1J4MPK1_9CRYT|nr:uncharacterized protein cubi_00350 [Cryptosporidium ubiquitum]OII74797.1 hypothetical protein cubi_00350 [Cryptosporidium ubiquitum]